MFRSTMRCVQLFLIALFMVVSMVGPASAQGNAIAFEPVVVQNEAGWKAAGRHAVADDFVLVCPNPGYDLPGNHPCNNSNSAPAQLGQMKDFVLVCPVEEVIEDHPCAERRTQVFNARPSDFVLVCPSNGKKLEEVPGEPHPCNQDASTMFSTVMFSIAKFEMPKDYVLTCPTLKVIEEGHPCSGRGR